MEITKISTQDIFAEKIHGNGHLPETSTSRTKFKFGWLPDYPDFRDYSSKNQEIADLLKGPNLATGPVSLPTSTDLRAWCPPIEDQESIGSCTANAGVALIEYFERRALGNHMDASRLFLYKATRNY